MPVYRLNHQPLFPPPDLAEKDGLLAVGGDLTPRRLLAAYSAGIFPWYSQGQPLLWWSPDPRMVLRLEWLHIPRSLKKLLRQQHFTITFHCAFPAVIRACSQTRAEKGTWITPKMEAADLRMHRLGHAHSVEAWILRDDAPWLAGGSYGVALGRCFFGESMFFRQANASKAAFAVLAQHLWQWGYTLIDCQMKTDHLLRFGAREIPRRQFLELLAAGQEKPTPHFLPPAAPATRHI